MVVRSDGIYFFVRPYLCGGQNITQLIIITKLLYSDVFRDIILNCRSMTD
jgi:hypothetical protein